jgi:NADPH:quinone reductase-like Zn-dependent oxidoreductase/acyl carrier protein
VVAAEHEQLRTVLIDLDPSVSSGELDHLLSEIAVPDGERELAWRGGVRYAARLARLEPARSILPDNQPYRLALPARGVLDNLAFEPLTRHLPGPGEVEVEVHATGLNFRDVLNVLGMYPGDPGPPGLECAGVITALGDGVTDRCIGDRVVALAARSFDSHVIARADLTVLKPDVLSFAEAVTIPSAFLTAAYGLKQLAGLQPGQRILIHAATGGVGLAAVLLAQQIGAEIFATASSPEKHAFLRALGVRHIFSSRTLDFADQVLQATDGRGVDVALNSLADEFIPRSLDVMATGGRFLEIGKRGIWSDEQVAARYPHVTYRPYDIGDVLTRQPDVITTLLRDLVALMEDGTLRPLPVRAFPASAIVEAFRYMAQARHIGKVVVTHRPSGGLVRPDATYLITGGLGGLGLAVAQWLVARGARHLALVGRRAPSPAAEDTLAALRAEASVHVFAADMADEMEVLRVLATLHTSAPPLRGVVHAAGVLDDGLLMQQTWARFRTVLAPKVDGAWLLDRHTRHLALDWFVLFSSASALLGAVGQANYAAANAVLDALAHQRQASGLPALSINWGAWSEVGMAAALGARDQHRIATRGMRSINPVAGVRALERLMAQSTPQVAVLPIDWPVLLAQLQPGVEPPLLADLASAEQRTGTSATVNGAVSLADTLAAASPEERAGLILAQLQRQVAEVLGLSLAETPSPLQPLNELGLDSLMAVELKNRVETRLGVALPMTTFLEGPSVETLATLVAERFNLPSGPAEAIGDAPAEDAGATAQPITVLSSLDQLSDDEVNAMLSTLLDERGVPR